MLKVLIVDDEIRVCRLIQCLIDWESLGLEVLGYVNDGLSAFNIIKEQNPDIVITDIRMPEYGGLELIQNAKSINSNAHFIIISGYSDFTYAQAAIKYGVDDYLLKPIKKKELLGTLDKIIANINVIQKNINYTESMQQQLDQRERKLKSKFLDEMLENVTTFDYSVEHINQTYYCHFTEDFYQVIGIQIVLDGITNPQTISFLNSKVQDTLLDYLTSFHETAFTYRDGVLFFLINGKDSSFHTLKNDMQRFRSSLLSFKEVFEGIRPVIALSEIRTSIDTVPILIDQVQETLLNKLFLSIDFVLLFTPRANIHSTDYIITNNFRKDFLLYIETFNYDELSSLFKKLNETLNMTKPIDGRYILDLYNEIISLFLFGIKNYGIHLDHKAFEHSMKEDFQQYYNLSKLFDNLVKQITKYLNEWQTEKALEHSKPIRQAKNYIKNNFRDPLTLETLGSLVGLNPTYFSSIFKKETGESFVDYLTEVRIQYAKDLLVNTSSSINNITELSGFNDLKYFNKKFKKFTGLSPSEYRKLYS